MVATEYRRTRQSVRRFGAKAEQLAQVGDWAYDLGMPPLIDKPERARQLARAIASDLTLYHEAKIVEGLQQDTLWDVMKNEIEEGRQLFKSRVTPDIAGLNLYDRALVDVMLKSKGHIKSKIW